MQGDKPERQMMLKRNFDSPGTGENIMKGAS
jgi:hypothetical protein